MFDEDKDYEVGVAHAEVEEENNEVGAGAVMEEEDRVVDEGEEVAVVAVAPVVREGEEERVDDAYANDGNADVIVEEDRLVDEAEEIAIAVADDDLGVREDGERVDGEQRAEENGEEGMGGREEDNAAGEEERVDDAYPNGGNADIIVEDRLVGEAEEVAIAVADDDLVVREVGEQWAEENDEEGMEGREEIDVVSEEERVDNASADDETASEDEEVVVAVDPVVREAEGRVDAEQSTEENDEEGVEGKEEDSIAGEEDEEDYVSVDNEAAAAALALRAEESSEEEDPAVQHVRTTCILMSRCTISITPLVEVNKDRGIAGWVRPQAIPHHPML